MCSKKQRFQIKDGASIKIYCKLSGAYKLSKVVFRFERKTVLISIITTTRPIFGLLKLI